MEQNMFSIGTWQMPECHVENESSIHGSCLRCRADGACAVF